MLGWWNWQTRQVEGLVAVTGCAGSNPAPSTIFVDRVRAANTR